MKTILVNAAEPYDVIVGRELLPSLGQALLARHPACSVALVCDETVYGLFGGQATQSMTSAGFTVEPVVIPAGEMTKTLPTVTMVLEKMTDMGLTRNDFVVGLGGGVSGDIAGFAASVYLRGIPYARVPTTLLAAVDASVGGKSSVNLPQGKNLVGALWDPFLVLCDCDTFDSLPAEEYLDGVAECLKYGVICDRALFEAVAQGVLDIDCMDTVARCVEIKAKYVHSADPQLGGRQLLNLGGTMGDAIEMLSGFTIPHGHSISIGMASSALVAEALGLCAMGCAGVLMAMLDRLGLPSETHYTAEELAQVAVSDRKRRGNSLTIVLPKSIGHCVLYPIKVDALPHLFRLAKGERA